MRLRNRFAVGLHLNLTFGPPLGSMPDLAPDGILPPPNVLICRTLFGYVDPSEIGLSSSANSTGSRRKRVSRLISSTATITSTFFQSFATLLSRR